MVEHPSRPRLSVVVPIYNESAGLRSFHVTLLEAVQKAVKADYEIIYCDDGSNDETASIVQQWHERNPSVKLLRLSRNFGKENALAAGIAAARGQAILTLDGDGQHPVELIPEFVAAWEAGAQVIIGVYKDNSNNGWQKAITSRLFYKLFNSLTDQKMLHGSTDFRLIDRAVQQAFLTLPESDRTTRGLIDWLGFKRQLIYFKAKSRPQGSPHYSRRQLFGLAKNSLVSLSPRPLYLFGYLGAVITATAALLGTAVIIEQLILGDPWHWKFTGTAMLGILTVFLIGIVLLSQGILSLYISHIHAQSKQRPLYVIDYADSAGITPHNKQ